MTKQNFLEYCLDTYSTSPDYPFDEDFETEVLRHADNRKWYANLPVSAYIIDARFTLYVDGTSNEVESSYLGAYQVTSSWDSSLTWNKHTASTSPQGTFGTEYVDFNNIHYVDGELQPIYSWNVTDIVKSWYGGTANYGIAISAISGYTTASLRFSSNDHSWQENRPKLCITYKDMKGVEDYWSYSSHSAGNAGSGSINLATGTLSFAIPTISTTDSLMPYTPTLVYNSALAAKYNNVDNAEVPYVNTNYMTGYGFKWTMNETIVERSYYDSTGEEVTYYVWSDSDGTEHYFYEDASGVYRDEDGLLLTLSENTTANTYTITDANHNVRQFSRNASDSSDIKAGGVLTNINDKNGNKLVFGRNANGRITRITLTPNGSSDITFITFSYNSSGAVSQITNSTAGQTVKFYYSTTPTGTSILTTNAGYLRRVERIYSDGTYTSNYTYDTSGRLIKARDEKSKYEINYTYTSSKITSVVEKSGSSSTTGQTVGITYNDGYTVVRTSGKDDVINNTDDILTRYSFDALGRAISVYSTDVSGTTIYGASSGEYVGDNEKAVNSLKSSLVVSGVSPNYILNGGFEQVSYDSSIGRQVTAFSTSYWTKVGTITSTSGLNGSQFGANIPVTSSTGGSISQNVQIPAGDYTLSLSLDTNDNEDVTVTVKASSVNRTKVYTETYGANDGGTVSLNITAGSYVSGGEKFTISISVSGGSGTASNAKVTVDNVMLSSGIGVNSFDSVAFGHFESTAYSSTQTPSTAWTITGGTIASTDTVFNNVLCITGALDEQNSASQIVFRADSIDYSTDVGFTDETTFRITGFAKGTDQTDNASSAFRLRVVILYYDGTTKTETFDFNNAQTDWQFVSGTFTICPSFGADAKSDVVRSVTVYCDYFNNPGTAYFDNITVTLVDNNAEFYEYDLTTGLPTMYRSSWWYREWYFYDDNNNLIKKITKNRDWIEYEYDPNNNLVSETLYRYSDTFFGNLDTFEGTKTRISKTTYTYDDDDFGLLTQTAVLTPSGTTSWTTKMTTTSAYNIAAGSKIFGSLATSTDSLGNVTRYFYNSSNGNLLAVINPDGATGTVYTYDGSGRVTMVRPASFNGTSYSAVSGEYAEYSYSLLGQLEYICTDTTQYNISYDAFGNTDYISVGMTEIVDYTYNSNNGKLNTITYGNGFVEEYVYDALDRISEIWYNNVKRYEYAYDVNGNIYKVTDIANDTILIYSYDDQNRVVKMVEYDATSLDLNSSVWQEYDEQSRLDTVTYDVVYGSGSSYYFGYNFAYDTNNNISEVSLGIGGGYYDYGEITYTYDALQRATNKTFTLTLNGSVVATVSSDYAFKTVNGSTSILVSQYVSKVNNTTTNTYNYTYDANGNITQITNASGVVQNKYYYDDMGQLIREDNKALGKTHVYTYDNAGNRTSKKTYAYTTSTTLGTVQSTETYSYPDNPEYEYWGDQLESFNGNTITYDDVGNPLDYYLDCYLGDECQFYLEWEGRNLVFIEDYAAAEFFIYYEYNDEGIRTSKTINDTEYKYTLNGLQIVSQEWEDKLMIFFYDESGFPIGYAYRTTSMTADTFYYYIYEKNLQGDIVAIYNTSGTKLVSYTYDAWGNVSVSNINVSGTNVGAQYNPFRYRGYYYDEEVGLYYLNSRYYDPNTGRFLNADGYLNANGDLIGFNMYAYCSNNPVMYTDPTGEFVLTTFLICVGIGAVAGGVLGGITAASNGQDVLTGVITGAVLGGAVGAVVGVGGAALTGAVSSTLSKVTTDLISVSMYGGSFGTWEDYALAFAFGGVTGSLGSAISAGNNIAKTAKFLLDVAARPAVNQLAKMGTRGGNFNAEKYSYDVITRSVTYGGTNMVMRGSVGGMNLNIDLGKCFFRAGFRGIYNLP